MEQQERPQNSSHQRQKTPQVLIFRVVAEEKDIWFGRFFSFLSPVPYRWFSIIYPIFFFLSGRHCGYKYSHTPQSDDILANDKQHL